VWRGRGGGGGGGGWRESKRAQRTCNSLLFASLTKVWFMLRLGEGEREKERDWLRGTQSLLWGI